MSRTSGSPPSRLSGSGRRRSKSKAFSIKKRDRENRIKKVCVDRPPSLVWYLLSLPGGRASDKEFTLGSNLSSFNNAFKTTSPFTKANAVLHRPYSTTPKQRAPTPNSPNSATNTSKKYSKYSPKHLSYTSNPSPKNDSFVSNQSYGDAQLNKFLGYVDDDDVVVRGPAGKELSMDEELAIDQGTVV